jgi:hypothetical protein
MKLEESEALAAAAFAGAGTHARVREVVADLPASRSSTPRKEDGSVAATELRELGGGKWDPEQRRQPNQKWSGNMIPHDEGRTNPCWRKGTSGWRWLRPKLKVVAWSKILTNETRCAKKNMSQNDKWVGRSLGLWSMPCPGCRPKTKENRQSKEDLVTERKTEMDSTKNTNTIDMNQNRFFHWNLNKIDIPKYRGLCPPSLIWLLEQENLDHGSLSLI